MDGMTIITGTPVHQSSHAASLAKGLAAHGVRTTIQRSNLTINTKHVACWGWRMGVRLRERGHEVLVMERGYLGDRFRWTSLGWNGLNGRAIFPRISEPSRFEAHFAHLVKHWNSDGEFVLLIGQVPGDMSLGGLNLKAWYHEMAYQARKTYGIPVRFRQHPLALERGFDVTVSGAQDIRGALSETLMRASVVVTFNSNTGVESCIAGRPTVATDIGSMAHPVAATKIGGKFNMIERMRWAHRLAWCQWQLSEIESGAAWDEVRKCAPVQ